jgi:UDP-arabinose 4-epimerase
MNNNVLVTGGAGYIGAHVCKALAKQGFTPIAVDNLCSGTASHVKWGPFEEADIRDRNRMSAILQKYTPAAIMHFAALIQVGESVTNPSKYYDNNICGSFALLEEARLNNIKNMVFSSTAAVYGIPTTADIIEDHPLKPINPYGQTKMAMENMVRDFSAAYGLRHAILRYFNAAGADTDCDIGTAYKVDTHIIPLLMRVASGHNKEITIFGTDYNTPDGTAIRDYLHVEDLAEAHILSLRHIMDGKSDLTLNLGTSHGHSVLQVLSAVREITGKNIPAVNAPRRAGDSAILVANAEQAKKILNWTPTKSDLKTIVETAWRWRQKQVEQSDNKQLSGV